MNIVSPVLAQLVEHSTVAVKHKYRIVAGSIPANRILYQVFDE